MLLLQFSWTRNFQRGRSQLNRLKGLRKCLQRQVFRLQNPLKHFNNQPKGKETYFCNPSMKRHMSPLLTPNSLALESPSKKAIKLRRRKMNTTSSTIAGRSRKCVTASSTSTLTSTNLHGKWSLGSSTNPNQRRRSPRSLPGQIATICNDLELCSVSTYTELKYRTIGPLFRPKLRNSV